MGGLSGREGICSLGTTTMLRICIEEPVLDDPATRRLQTYPLFSGTWATGGGINNAGVVLQWCKDQLLAAESYEEVLAEAAEVSPGCDGLFCMPYLSGERDPRISEDASGMFLGVRQHHCGAHFARAVLEGVAYTVNLIKEASADNGIELEDIRICGSGSQSDLWCRIFADVCGVPVLRSVEHDATLTGTAMLASVATGAYPDLEAATEKMVEAGQTFEPDPEHQAIYPRAFECFEELLTDARRLYAIHARHMAEE
jgi:gluconokinase